MKNLIVQMKMNMILQIMKCFMEIVWQKLDTVFKDGKINKKKINNLTMSDKMNNKI